MKKSLLLGAGICAIALMGAGCGQSVSDRVAEQAIQATVGGNAKVGGLPSNFPTDVPTYPGATVASALVQDQISIANMTSSDDPQKVSDWYDSTLKAAGFTQDESMVLTGTVRVYHKGTVALTVTVGKQGNNPTAIIIQRAEKGYNGQ